MLASDCDQNSILAATIATEYWTSGSNEGDFCDVEQLYSWCSLGRTYRGSDMNSSALMRGNSTNNRCLALDVMMAMMVYSGCAERKELVCQVRKILKPSILCLAKYILDQVIEQSE